MDDLFEQVSGYLSEPRYRRLKFTPVTEALPPQNEMVTSPLTGALESSVDERQQQLELEVTQLLPPNEEQELHDEDEDTQKVALPKVLNEYLQNQKTADLGAANSNGARKELQKQQGQAFDVAAPNGSRKPFPERSTWRMRPPNSPGRGIPERAARKPSTTPENRQNLPERETSRLVSPNGTNSVNGTNGARRSLPERETSHLGSPNGTNGTNGVNDTNGVRTELPEQEAMGVSVLFSATDEAEDLPQRETLKVVIPPGVKRREVGLDESLAEQGQRERARLEARKSDISNLTDDDVDEFDTVPMMVLKGIAKQQGSPQPAMKSEIKSAAGSAAYVSAGNIGGTLLKYGGNLVIQRGLGAAAFGLYTLSFSVMTLVASIFKLGLDDAMLRYVSVYHTKRQGSTLRGLTIFCTLLAGTSGILGALAMFYYAPYLAAVKHSREIIPILEMMAPMVPLLVLQLIWINGLQGFKEFKWRVLIQRILIPGLLIVMLLGALLLFHNLNAIVIATLINAVMATSLSLFFFFRKVSRVAKERSESYELREWFGFAAPNFLTSIIDTILQSIDTILLAYFAISNVALGLYAAAIKISAFIVMPQVSFNAMFAPTIAELYSIGERQKLEAMFKVVTKWVITFTLPIFGIATIFSTSLLAISGQVFIAAWPLVIAFSIGNLINVATGSVGYMLLMTGHTRISFLNSLTAVVVNIVVGIILAPRYGAMGVAVATGLAVAVVNLMRLLQVRLLLKMQPYRWDVLKPLAAGVISGAITGVLLYLMRLAHLEIHIGHATLFYDLALVPVFLALYFGILALFKVSPEDKIILDTLRKKFGRGKKNKKKR